MGGLTPGDAGRDRHVEPRSGSNRQRAAIPATVDPSSEVLALEGAPNLMALPITSAGKTSAIIVLVVEDDGEVCQTITDVIEAQGYRVISVGNGQEALAVLEEERPSLMLIDVFMPVMNGVELLKAVRLNPELANIPRVIMTATNDRMIGVRQDVPVLYKPVDFDALTGIVQRYCALVPS
jgi:CheY-like chemotaxis protein